MAETRGTVSPVDALKTLPVRGSCASSAQHSASSTGFVFGRVGVEQREGLAERSQEAAGGRGEGEGEEEGCKVRRHASVRRRDLKRSVTQPPGLGLASWGEARLMGGESGNWGVGGGGKWVGAASEASLATAGVPGGSFLTGAVTAAPGGSFITGQGAVTVTGPETGARTGAGAVTNCPATDTATVNDTVTGSETGAVTVNQRRGGPWGASAHPSLAAMGTTSQSQDPTGEASLGLDAPDNEPELVRFTSLDSEASSEALVRLFGRKASLRRQAPDPSLVSTHPEHPPESPPAQPPALGAVAAGSQAQDTSQGRSATAHRQGASQGVSPEPLVRAAVKSLKGLSDQPAAVGGARKLAVDPSAGRGPSGRLKAGAATLPALPEGPVAVDDAADVAADVVALAGEGASREGSPRGSADSAASCPRDADVDRLAEGACHASSHVSRDSPAGAGPGARGHADMEPQGEPTCLADPSGWSELSLQAVLNSAPGGAIGRGGDASCELELGAGAMNPREVLASSVLDLISDPLVRARIQSLQVFTDVSTPSAAPFDTHSRPRPQEELGLGFGFGFGFEAETPGSELGPFGQPGRYGAGRGEGDGGLGFGEEGERGFGAGHRRCEGEGEGAAFDTSPCMGETVESDSVEPSPCATPRGEGEASPPPLRRSYTAKRGSVLEDCWLTGAQRRRKAAAVARTEDAEECPDLGLKRRRW